MVDNPLFVGVRRGSTTTAAIIDRRSNNIEDVILRLIDLKTRKNVDIGYYPMCMNQVLVTDPIRRPVFDDESRLESSKSWLNDELAFSSITIDFTIFLLLFSLSLSLIFSISTSWQKQWVSNDVQFANVCCMFYRNKID